jgi:Gas vesicle synthesis protein GvpL/GvpF
VALYVYGIVEAGSRGLSGRGIEDAPLRVIDGEDVSALVSDIDADHVRLGREAVLLHARVLEHALERGPVLPMRFGVVMSGPDEVQRRLLEEHADELRTQLTEFTGKVEIRIRAVYEEDVLMREVVREHPQIASLRESIRAGSDDATYYERIRLGELVAAAVERRRARDADAIVEALASAAVAVEVGEPTHERVAVQASFLVDRDHLGQFDRIVDDVAASYGGGIRFKYVGPLPPHSFVELAERV